MKKKIVAALSAALLALALPTAALAWESPTGAVKAETVTVTTASGVTVKAAAAANGTGTLTVEEAASGVRAENAPATAPEGTDEIGSFKITATGDVEAPYNFSYNLGAEYANAEVTVYVQHEEEGVEDEVITKTASSDGTVTFSTQNLSIHTIFAKKAAGAAKATDTSSKSPQTGMNTGVVAGATATAAVAAAGVALALRKRSE